MSHQNRVFLIGCVFSSACSTPSVDPAAEEVEVTEVSEELKVTPPAVTDAVFTITNNCSMDVWMAFTPNAGSPALPAGIVKLAAKGGTHGYSIPSAGWAGRLWPKTGCDTKGDACTTGQAVPPCPATGCQPPADTKVEFFFGPAGGTDRPFYDVSLVDGYSLGAEIVPSTSGGRCTPTSCALDLSKCPTAEIESIGNLQIPGTGTPVQCFAPCKKWTWPTPLGDGGTEADATGQAMCCPSPVTPEACNAGTVGTTQYVTLVHEECPSAYAFSYDDKGGSHDCDPGTTFQVTLCPGVPAVK